MKKTQTLLQKLLFYLILPTIILLLASFTLIYRYTYQALQEQHENAAFNSLHQISSAVERFASEINSVVLAAGFNESLINPTNPQLTTQAQRVKARQEFISSVNQQLMLKESLHGVIMITSDGEIFGGSNSFTYTNASIRDFFNSEDGQRVSDKGTTWLSGYDDRYFSILAPGSAFLQRKTPVLICARRLIHANQEEGVSMLLFLIKQSAFDEIFSTFTLPYDNMYLLDENQHLIWYNGAEPNALPAFLQSTSSQSASFDADIEGDAMHILHCAVGKHGWHIYTAISNNYYLSNLRGAMIRISAVGVCAVIMLIALSTFTAFRLTRPLKQMTDVMNTVGQGNLTQRIALQQNVTEFGIIAASFNRMVDNLSNLFSHDKQMEQEKHAMELNALQYQINPHFLFNTITSVRWIAVMIHADSVSNALEHLASLLRPMYKSSSSIWILRDEQEFLQHYIALMELRFGNKIETSMEIDPSLLDISIPRFIIQPLLENIYEHAISDRKINVSLSIRSVDGTVAITIDDNGAGMPPQKLAKLLHDLDTIRPVESGGSLGILNVYRRLQLIYGNRATFLVQSSPDDGFHIRIIISF